VKAAYTVDETLDPLSIGRVSLDRTQYQVFFAKGLLTGLLARRVGSLRRMILTAVGG
jgi:hypothetical protein